MVTKKLDKVQLILVIFFINKINLLMRLHSKLQAAVITIRTLGMSHFIRNTRAVEAVEAEVEEAVVLHHVVCFLLFFFENRD